MLRTAFLTSVLALIAVPGAAADTCALCFDHEPASPGERPLTIEIDAGLTFSRLALTGKGEASAEIDAQTGQKRTSGGIVDLGGTAVQGRARINGVPHRAVRIELPPSVAMTSTSGAAAELTDFTTDLPPNPVLDAGGSLEFAFGGRLRIDGPAGGSLRGRIPISVDYN